MTTVYRQSMQIANNMCMTWAPARGEQGGQAWPTLEILTWTA